MDGVCSLRECPDDKSTLGTKGANLVIMTQMGLPVPPGFVITTRAYQRWREDGSLPTSEIESELAALEREMGRSLGQELEVSVRSSAAVSMPGMMDTVLNIGDRAAMYDAIRRVLRSWESDRANGYRQLNSIPAETGTAAVVQAMVYGNRDERSGTGVAFTRDPSTGEKGLFGEYLSRAQGEELVSGTRTPQTLDALRSAVPEAYAGLEQAAANLERHFCDVQDMEFTVESGDLYVLQTRSAKRTGRAAVKVAVDMVHEGLIVPEEAIARATVADIDGLLHKQLRSPGLEPVVRGLNAAPGAVGGRVVFDAQTALAQAKKGVPVILVRPETTPDDVQGIAAADGVLTQRGGMTSHAAIVTRAMGKPCVSGAETITVDVLARRFSINGQVVAEGDEVTIDGTTGNVYLGLLPVEDVSLPPEMGELMSWTSGFARLGVRANADTPEMIAQAKRFGAEGVGLCRTERMFNGPERLATVRELILAESGDARAAAIERLRELQTEDFAALFEALEGLPIIIRLLDLPLHEFLPPASEVSDPRMRQRAEELRETNPMLGHRGVRLAVTMPAVYGMQIGAIAEAMSRVPARVSVMVPQVVTLQEVLLVKRLLEGSGLHMGIMLETVRACLRAGRIAPEVDFLSFGTNDLTQAVYSFSREDVEKEFLSTYLEMGILQDNPFKVLDVKGVGRLMETAIFWARRAKKEMEIGVCGEHGGEPRSIRYLHGTGVDYVSVSPFRVFRAKLVAAQAAIEGRLGGM